MSYSLLNSKSFGKDNWCLKFQPLYNQGLLTSLSNGEIHVLDWQTNETILNIKAEQTNINNIKVLNNDFNNSNCFATASMHAVKIFDVRSSACIATIKNEKNSPFLSLDSRHGYLACGTELQGIDAELHIYDFRNWNTPMRSLVDSHHDDITDIKFHPSDKTVLMSGSTDGYANIYDLTQEEEDDALHQVINYASIHSCGWLTPKRIYTLSHMETFAIHELNDKTEELKEPQPTDFGDIRDSWSCDYVIDVYQGYIATGKSTQGSGNLCIIPFANEQVYTSDKIVINSAHGDEVIRDVFIPAQKTELLYSCGEDGCVKVWRNPNSVLSVSEQLWDYSKKMHVLDDNSTESEVNDERPEKSSKVKKDRKDKKDKKDKKKRSKAPRYKPY